MSIAEKIDADIKEAMKASEKLRLETLRMAKSALKYRQIEKGGPLSDEDAVSVLGGLAKQRRESAGQFRAAGREELARKEEEELEIIRSYMPRQLTDAELDAAIEEAIKESGAAGLQDLGKVMKALMPKIKGAADGKTVNEKVRKALEARASA